MEKCCFWRRGHGFRGAKGGPTQDRRTGGWLGASDDGFEASSNGNSAGTAPVLAIVPNTPHGLSPGPGLPGRGASSASDGAGAAVAAATTPTPTSALIAESMASAVKDNVFTTSRSMLRGKYRNHTSCAGALEESPRFQNTTLVVIVVNAIWICIDIQWNHKSLAVPFPDGPLPLEPYSTVVENLFCAYFTSEVLVRFVALKGKLNCFWDFWFLFDTFLVLLMVLESWIVPIIAAISIDDGKTPSTAIFSSMRLLRLLRLTRMARLMSFFPELMTLVKGMINATQAVGFILLFLCIVTYVFAIAFTVQLGSPDTVFGPEGSDLTAAEMFSDLGSSFMVLFTNGMLGDNLYQTLVVIKNDSDILMWVFIVYYFISSMTLLNMLIGVLCAVIGETAKTEAEARSLWELRRTIKEAFDAVDSSKDGDISAEEWAVMREKPSLRKMFLSLGVEPNQLDDRLDQLQETVFGKQRATANGLPDGAVEGRGMSFDQFMNKVIELKWDESASALDMEVLQAQAAVSNKDLRKRLIRVEAALEGLLLEEDEMEVETCTTPTADATPSFVFVEDTVSLPPVVGKSGGRTESSDAAPNEWLNQVPTELLFHVLKMRSAPP
mmetsp:Transcript_132339/g.423440  ORF Transcript_132339/g.423440 Transcript_132339/m.423440 type:complete len:609 (-) Transcript_132339:122-1948(-)